jgi:hypothetical protein
MVPWPQPVVTVRLAIFSSQSTIPAPRWVAMLTCSRSQSTVTDSMSSIFSTSRWFRR